MRKKTNLALGRPLAVAGLLLAILSSSVLAAPPRVIQDDELKPYMQDLEKRIRNFRKGNLPAEKLVEDIGARAAASDLSPRERAIRIWLYGHALHQLRRDVPAARIQYERAYAIHREFPALVRGMAGCAIYKRDYRKAKKLLNETLRYDRDDIQALLLLGRVHLNQHELDEAERCFKDARDTKMTPDSLVGLQDVYSMRHKRARRGGEEQKEFASKVVGAAEAHVIIAPDSPIAHLLRARAYKDVGQVERAAELLEESVANDKMAKSPKFRREALLRLAELYQRLGNVKKVKSSLKRVLQLKELEGADRERITTMIADLDEKGIASFLIWRAQGFMEIVKNQGIDVRSRVRALGTILELVGAKELSRDPHLNALRVEMFREIFRMLVSDKPEITKEILKWIEREIRDPNLLRILVHFVYPSTDVERTPPSVRVAAVRALDEAVGIAALPTIYYCIKDPSGTVLRDVDKALARQFEERSPVGGGIRALKKPQILKCRKYWRMHVRNEFGAAKLAAAYVELAAAIAPDPSQAAGQSSAPLVDHTVNLVLDNDLPWQAWKPAYEFLVHYWGKDFRPPEQREKPVTKDQRAAIVRELEADWDGTAGKTKPEVADPGAAAGKDSESEG